MLFIIEIMDIKSLLKSWWFWLIIILIVTLIISFLPLKCHAIMGPAGVVEHCH